MHTPTGAGCWWDQLEAVTHSPQICLLVSTSGCWLIPSVLAAGEPGLFKEDPSTSFMSNTVVVQHGSHWQETQSYSRCELHLSQEQWALPSCWCTQQENASWQAQPFPPSISSGFNPKQILSAFPVFGQHFSFWARTNKQLLKCKGKCILRELQNHRII